MPAFPSRIHSDVDPAQQARMWRQLARQCRAHGVHRLAEEADALARIYEARIPAAPQQHEQAA